MKKLVVWGYTNADTLSYVWRGFVNAAKKILGENNVIWLTDDNNSNVIFHGKTDWSDTVFLCEAYQSKFIPIHKDATYLVHTFVAPYKDKFLSSGARIIDLRYNCDYQNHNTNYKYTLNRKLCKQLGTLVHYQQPTVLENYEKLYVAWATDLPPEEIRIQDLYTKKDNRSVFIGTKYNDKYSNSDPLHRWEQACKDHGVEFFHNDPWVKPLTPHENRLIVRDAHSAPDLRGQENINCGYIPCRIFKNISYGQLGLTNSRAVHAAMDEMTIYHSDPYELFKLHQEYRNNQKLLFDQITYVKENHTYVNRLSAMMKIL